MTVYDYSWARPDPAALDEGVIRYLCPTSNGAKRLQASELAALHAAGKPVGLVWEADAFETSWNGAEANGQADALGFPAWVPIYYAVDYGDANGDKIANALDAQPGPRPKGIYAGARIVQRMIDEGHATHGWIAGAYSWSVGPPYTVARVVALAPSAHLVQLVGTDIPGTDRNTVLRPDWGGYLPGAADMPLANDEIKAVAKAVWDAGIPNLVDSSNPPAYTMLGGAHLEAWKAAQLKVDPGAIADAVVAKLGGTADVAAIKAALVEVLREGTG